MYHRPQAALRPPDPTLCPRPRCFSELCALIFCQHHVAALIAFTYYFFFFGGWVFSLYKFSLYKLLTLVLSVTLLRTFFHVENVGKTRGFIPGWSTSALGSAREARLRFFIMSPHRLHLDLTTISSSYELPKSNFIFAFAESKKRREGINPAPRLLNTTLLPSAEGVCSREADRKPAAFPGKKKPCVLRAALGGCLLVDREKKKKIKNPSSEPQGYF